MEMRSSKMGGQGGRGRADSAEGGQRRRADTRRRRTSVAARGRWEGELTDESHVNKGLSCRPGWSWASN